MLASFVRQSKHSITGHVIIQIYRTAAAAQATAKAVAQALPPTCGGCVVRRHQHGTAQAWAVSVPVRLGPVRRSLFGAVVRTATPLVGQPFNIVGGSYV